MGKALDYTRKLLADMKTLLKDGSKSTIIGWIKKNKPIAVDKNTTITVAEYQSMLKKNKRLEEWY